MDKAILDTSIIIKWFLQEEDSDRALNLLDKIKNQSLEAITPSIVFLELTNALFFSGHPTLEATQKAIRDFSSLGLEIITPDIPLIEKTISQMFKWDIASYDALFITLAEEIKVPLITADKKHHKKRFSKWIKYLSD
ncbi:type II toxin-antitoxin system VapC family toxin [Candidatus Gottesmanbacteria bacterium]|nr:type II toxin-antitoxin system VapC family toxin [Candidatus Gottesmanbacteria bacterium]